MAKLNQIIAVEKGVKSRAFQELTESHHAAQKPALRAESLPVHLVHR